MCAFVYCVCMCVCTYECVNCMRISLYVYTVCIGMHVRKYTHVKVRMHVHTREGMKASTHT